MGPTGLGSVAIRSFTWCCVVPISSTGAQIGMPIFNRRGGGCQLALNPKSCRTGRGRILCHRGCDYHLALDPLNRADAGPAQPRRLYDASAVDQRHTDRFDLGGGERLLPDWLAAFRPLQSSPCEPGIDALSDYLELELREHAEHLK